jgi:hypothetical protein
LLSLLGEPPWVSLLSMRRGNHFMTPFKRCKLASGENKCFKGENITGCLEGNNFKCRTLSKCSSVGPASLGSSQRL